jgi:hypothetical protein
LALPAKVSEAMFVVRTGTNVVFLRPSFFSSASLLLSADLEHFPKLSHRYHLHEDGFWYTW